MSQYCTFRCKMCAPGARDCVFGCGDVRTCEYSRKPGYGITTSRSYPSNVIPQFYWVPKLRKLNYPMHEGGRDFSQWILVFSWLGFELNLVSPEVPG